MINKNLQPTTHNLQPKAGFVMLFSVLISSLLVVVGLSIFNITLKEMTISTAGRESQVAFFAANSGLECALYWDLKGDVIKDISAFAFDNSDERYKEITATCNRNRVNIDGTNNTTITNSSGNTATTNFHFNITGSNDLTSNTPCADVVVIKTNNGKDTKIQSQGTNICSGGRRVQRGLQATFTR